MADSRATLGQRKQKVSLERLVPESQDVLKGRQTGTCQKDTRDTSPTAQALDNGSIKENDGDYGTLTFLKKSVHESLGILMK